MPLLFLDTETLATETLATAASKPRKSNAPAAVRPGRRCQHNPLRAPR
jgi:hypothetical protein